MDEMGFGTAVDPWMSGLRTAAASGAVGGASVSSRMSGATGGDCVSDGCDGLFESERRSPSGAAWDALAGACMLRGRGIGRLARALRCAANAASMSIDKSIDKSIGVSIDALIGLPTGLSASLSAPDLSAPAGSSAPKDSSAPAGLAAADDIGSADADTARRSPSGAAADALAGACVLRGRGIERLARALRCANAASMSVAAPIDVSIDALIGLLTGLSASLSAPDLSTPTGSSTAAGPSAPKGSSAASGLAEDDIGSADADTPRPSLVPGDVVPGDAPPDVTPLTSPSSWTGVLMKHLPCPTHHGRFQAGRGLTPTRLNDAHAPGST